MKMLSIAGVTCYVKDPAKTAEFYKKLGFVLDKNEPDYVSVRLNWFWINFYPQDKANHPELQKEANMDNKGAGESVHVKVDDADEFYKGLLDKGFKPSGEPQDLPWGTREFLLRDPDGYKLVFFQKTK
jgi:catechol 2,3-dioxygenase-like lactoylglutathione lyase family enzyme